ncbi:MAG: DNA repair protein RadC [Anaerolineales bacterium]|nr:DNA repair protein RadC [Anaerolineales bacterium]
MDQLTLFPLPDRAYSAKPVRPTLAIREKPGYRVLHNSSACNGAELIAAMVGGSRSLETAQRLLNAFGSLHGIARTSCAELTAIQGVRASAVLRLKAAVEIGRRLLVPEGDRPQIRSPADAAAILQPLLMHQDQEHLYVLLLDTRNRVIGEPLEVYHGSLNTSLIRVGELYRDAIRANAAAIILSHNHPSGDPSPSPEDVAVTRAVIEAGKLLDIACLDHVILGGMRHVSLKERGLGFG